MTARNVQFYDEKGGNDMEEKTLHEVCVTFGVTRRAVQGYEKAGLVSPSGKNERGYLLYDKRSQDKIRQIKRYQQLGFQVKEIKKLLNASENELKEALRNQIVKLTNEKEEKDVLIKMAKKLIEEIK